MRPQSSRREFSAFRALEGAENDVKDRQRVGEILVAMFRESRVMDAMNLGRNYDVVEPREMDSNG